MKQTGGEQKMKWTKAFDKHGVVAALLIAFFIIFMAITCVSPLAGDDWAYAVNSIDHHPIILAIQTYFSWSGRLLSEFWGYSIPRNKWIYDILNPVFFTSIFVLILKLADVRKHPVLSTLLVFFLILSVEDYLRMQTYTWCMGETYVIPLLIFLWIVWYLHGLLFGGREITKKQDRLLCVLCFCGPLYMENAAAMITGGLFLVLLYCWFLDKEHFKRIRKYFLYAVVATLIIGLSPGAKSRLQTTQTAFWQMGFLQKIHYNWQNFLTFTFMTNKWLILVFCIVFLLFIWMNRKQYPYAKWHLYLLSIPFVFGIVQSRSEMLATTYGQSWASIFYDLSLHGSTRLNTAGYGLLVLVVLWILWSYLKGEKRWMSLFFFLCAGGANIVMLVSPIFDARSSIYTVFLFILLCTYILEQLEFPKPAWAVLMILLCVLNYQQVSNYAEKYYEVFRANNERQFQLRGFQNDPSLKEVYIVRMPRMSLHSADIEDADEYHMKYFKKYYNLSPDIVLHFYFRDDYHYYGEPLH